MTAPKKLRTLSQYPELAAKIAAAEKQFTQAQYAARVALQKLNDASSAVAKDLAEFQEGELIRWEERSRTYKGRVRSLRLHPLGDTYIVQYTVLPVSGAGIERAGPKEIPSWAEVSRA